VLHQYSIFGRAVKASNAALPSSIRFPVGEAVVRRQPSRYAGISHWATVNGDEVCVVVSAAIGSMTAPDTDAACNSEQYLESHGELLTQSSFVGGSKTPPATSEANVISGLAPNGVTAVTVNFADGSHAEVPVEDNGFVYTTGSASKRVQGVAWKTATGQARQQ
jgi:hypothetical protein